MTPLSDHLHVLVVDDDPDALELTRALIRKAHPDSRVAMAAGARAAMDYLLRATDPAGNSPGLPHVVFLDVNMPGLSGFEVLRWIRRNRSLATVKAVMLSTSDAGADIKRATELGAEGYLIKFPNPSCLAALLNHVREQSLGPHAPEPAPHAAPP